MCTVGNWRKADIKESDPTDSRFDRSKSTPSWRRVDEIIKSLVDRAMSVLLIKKLLLSLEITFYLNNGNNKQWNGNFFSPFEDGDILKKDLALKIIC